MLIIQIQPHSPQNTHTHILSVEKKGLFCPKSQSLSSAPSDDRYITACITALARKRQNSGLILCSTLYTTKPCVFFLQLRHRFLSYPPPPPKKKQLSLKKGDVNKGKCVLITMLLIHRTKVFDGMLFRGHLPFLTKPGFTAVDVFATQYYTKLVCTTFYYGCFDVYCFHKFSKYIPYKLSIKKQQSIVDA